MQATDILWRMGSEDRVNYLHDHIDEFVGYPDLESTVVEVWATGEVGDFNLDRWQRIFSRIDISRLHGDELPSRRMYTAYRGCTTDSMEDFKGLSWSLNQRVAKWFATTQRRYFLEGMVAGFIHVEKPTVYQYRFKADDILFYYNGRDEEEIVIKPDRIPLMSDCRVSHYKAVNTRGSWLTDVEDARRMKEVQKIGSDYCNRCNLLLFDKTMAEAEKERLRAEYKAEYEVAMEKYAS